MIRNILIPILFLMLLPPAAYACWGDDTFTEEDILALIEELDAEGSYARREAIEDLGRAGPDATIAIPKLVEMLYDENDDISREARDSLACIGEESVPYLLGLVNDPDDKIREKVILALGAIGDEPGVIPAIRVMLHDENVTLQNAAATAAGYIGPDAKELLPEIIELLMGDQWNNYRYKITDAIIGIGLDSDDMIATIISLLGDYSTQYCARQVLEKMGPEVVPHLVDAYGSGDEILRYGVISTLGNMGPDARDAVPFLLDTLVGPHPETRQSAAYSLGYIGAVNDDVIPALINAVKNGDDGLCFSAAHALGYIGPDAADAIDELTDALRERPLSVGVQAAFAMGRIGTDDPDSIEALCDVFEKYSTRTEGVPKIRTEVITTLGGIGPTARAAIPDLLDILHESENHEEIVSAINATGKIGVREPGVVDALIEAMSHTDPKICSAALKVFAYSKEACPEGLQEFIRLLSIENKYALDASTAIFNIGPDVIPRLIDEYHRTEPCCKYRFIDAIAKFGPDAEYSIPFLIEALDMTTANVSASVVKAFGEIGPGAAEVVPILIEKLDDETLRSDAINALGKIGPAARDAVPKLLEISELEGVRANSIIDALGTIGPEPGVVEYFVDKLRERDY